MLIEMPFWRRPSLKQKDKNSLPTGVGDYARSSTSTGLFSTEAGKSDPADFPPMRVQLLPHKRPLKVKARRYPPHQRAFFNAYIKQLVEMKFLVPNPEAEWQAALILIPKPGSRAKLRIAINFRPVNAATVK